MDEALIQIHQQLIIEQTHGVQQGQTPMPKEVARQHSNVKECLGVIKLQVEPLHGVVIQLIIALQQVSHRTIQVGITQTTIPPTEVRLHRLTIAIEDQHRVAQRDHLLAAHQEVRQAHQGEGKSDLGLIVFLKI